MSRLSRLSLCLIAKNEGKTLPKLFASLGQHFQGEIVLVDTGSTDDTVQVAKDFGATVYEVGDRFRVTITHEDLEKMAKVPSSQIFKANKQPIVAGDSYFNFGAARNYAVSLCKNDLIVMPDCDEVFVRVNWGVIERYFHEAHARLLTADIIHNRHNTDFVIDKTCIFDRRYYRCEHIVHENWAPLGQQSGVIKLSDEIVLLRHIKEEEKPRDYNVALLHCYVREPRNSHYIYHLARDFAHNLFYRERESDNYVDAMRLLQGLIDRIEAGEKIGITHYECYGMMIYALGLLATQNPELYNAVKHFCYRSLCFAGVRAETYLQLAEVSIAQRLYSEAIVNVRAAVASIDITDYNEISTKVPFLYREHPYVLLYKALYVLSCSDPKHVAARNDAYKKIRSFAAVDGGEARTAIHLVVDTPAYRAIAETLARAVAPSGANVVVTSGLSTTPNPFASATYLIGAWLLEQNTDLVLYPNTVVYNSLPLQYASPSYLALLREFSVLETLPANKKILQDGKYQFKFLAAAAPLTMTAPVAPVAPVAPEAEAPLIVFDCGENVTWDPLAAHVAASGAEIVTLQLAKEFVALGYQVVVFGKYPREGSVDGVHCLDHRRYLTFVEQTPIEALFVGRFPENIVYRDSIRAVFLWLHDTVPLFRFKPLISEMPPIQVVPGKFKGIICLSEWHKRMVKQFYPAIERQTKIFVSRNAIDVARWNSARASTAKVPFRFIYTSYANRGLDTLLRLMPSIKARYPETHLHIYCREDDLLSYNARAIIAENARYITRFDRVSQSALATAYAEADVWLYPTTSTETYCITALEAQAAGCLCVTTKSSALETTVGSRGVLVDPDLPNLEETLLARLFFVLDRPDVKNALIARGIEFAQRQTYSGLAQEWIRDYGLTAAVVVAAGAPVVESLSVAE